MDGYDWFRSSNGSLPYYRSDHPWNPLRLNTYSYQLLSLSMTDLAVESFPAWKAILWCFYPMTVLVMVEIFLRAADDDDDDEGGKGIRIQQPVAVPSGA